MFSVLTQKTIFYKWLKINVLQIVFRLARCVQFIRQSNRKQQVKKEYIMKKENIAAVLPGVIAVVAIVLSLRVPVSPDSLAGFASVLMLLGIAALEYRLSWKTLFGR